MKRSDEHDPNSVTAARLTTLLGKNVEEADVVEMRQKLAAARQRAADTEEAKRPKCDQTCAKCAAAIPHGEPFVPILRYVRRGHVANPNFIGRQPVAWGVETEASGALCLTCVGVPAVREAR